MASLAWRATPPYVGETSSILVSLSISPILPLSTLSLHAVCDPIGVSTVLNLRPGGG